MLTRGSFSQELRSPPGCRDFPPSHTPLRLGVWSSSHYRAIRWFDVKIVMINCKLALCAHVAFSPIQNVLPFILIKSSEKRALRNIACREPITGLRAHSTDAFTERERWRVPVCLARGGSCEVRFCFKAASENELGTLARATGLIIRGGFQGY